MHILVTNDDSISATGLEVLIDYCRQFGQVTAVVPAVQQSGKSHGIELHRPFRVERQADLAGCPVWTVDSTPADCVRFAVNGLGLRFDLAVSGINNGYNIGKDIPYSGTAGAAYEAFARGVPAVALSARPDCYDVAHLQLPAITDFFRERRLLEVHSLYNINIPPNPKGIRITRQGGEFISDKFRKREDGLWEPEPLYLYRNRDDLTLDTDCVMHGWISVLPLTPDRTDREVYRQVQGAPVEFGE